MTASGESNAAPRGIDGMVVGVLVGPHGIRGEVKLRPSTEFPERIPQMKQLRMRYPDGHEETRALLGTRNHKEMVLLRVEGVNSREDAEVLRGVAVLQGLDEAPELPEGRYYHHQIMGLKVVTPEGEELGRIRDILVSGANDVYVAGKYLIPATHDAILRLAPEEGVVVVRSKEYLEGEVIS